MTGGDCREICVAQSSDVLVLIHTYIWKVNGGARRGRTRLQMYFVVGFPIRDYTTMTTTAGTENSDSGNRVCFGASEVEAFASFSPPATVFLAAVHGSGWEYSACETLLFISRTLLP